MPERPSEKIPHLVLRSAWQTCNIGDICLTPAMLGVLRRNFGEMKITCWAHAVNDPIRRLAEQACPGISWIQGGLGSPGQPPDRDIEDILSSADFFLYNSGPLFTYRGGAQQWDYSINSALPLFFCQARGIPYALYAQSFELAPPAGMVLGNLFSGAAAISCRDSRSLSTLQGSGVRKAELAPDIAFAFEMRNEHAAEDFLCAECLAPGGFLAVCSHYAIESRPGVCEHGERYAATIRAVIERWTEQTGLPVLLYPEDDREIGTNHEFLYSRLSAKARALVRERKTFWLPDEALAVLSKARAIFSMEPHGMMMVLGNAGIPVLHPMIWEFGIKAQLWADIGLEDWLFDLEATDASHMSRVLLDIHERYDGARAMAKAASQRVNEDLQRTWSRQGQDWTALMAAHKNDQTASG